MSAAWTVLNTDTSLTIRYSSLTCMCWLLVLSRSECLGESLQLPPPLWAWSSCRRHCTGSVWGHRVRWHHRLWKTTDLKGGHVQSMTPTSKDWVVLLLFSFLDQEQNWPWGFNSNKYPQNYFKSLSVLHISVFDSFSSTSPEIYHNNKHSFIFPKAQKGKEHRVEKSPTEPSQFQALHSGL